MASKEENEILSRLAVEGHSKGFSIKPQSEAGVPLQDKVNRIIADIAEKKSLGLEKEIVVRIKLSIGAIAQEGATL